MVSNLLDYDAKKRVADYVSSHLAEMGRRASDLADEILEDKILSQDECPYNLEKRRELLRKRMMSRLQYIKCGIEDLQKLGAITISPAEQDQKKEEVI